MRELSTFGQCRPPEPLPGKGGTLCHGRLALDPKAQLAVIDGRWVELTRFECHILERLIRRRGSVVTKGELASSLYGTDSPPRSNVIEVLVARLRRKLDPGSHRLPIQTLRGRGYRLRG